MSLSGSNVAQRINCIAHLKRAAECQLDTFLHIMNLRPKRKRMSFSQKLETIRPFGILSPRALAKLNQIRNRLEHEYASPEVADLEIYFELVSAFAYAIEGFILMLKVYGETSWGDDLEKPTIELAVEYHRKGPSVRFQCHSDEDSESVLEFSPADGDAWGHAVRLFFLLCRCVDLVTDDFVLAHLDPVPATPPIGGDAAGDV